ncbi:MAG: peroxiredoxin [Myxococcales bacterium]|nr:peroxiredoxin [Myxococcales bacterium]
MTHRWMITLALLLAACGGDSSADEPPPPEEGAGGEEAPPEGAPTGETSEEGSEPAAATDDGYLAVGTEAPDFSALDQTGMTRRLSSLRGQVVVLYFYPRDETPGCTAEACAFRDVWDRYEEADVAVLGVSVDSVESHLAFAQRHSLPFSLIADVDGAISTAYQVLVTDSGPRHARRVTYVIDADGTIRHVFGNVDPGIHAEEVLAAIAGQ